MGEWQTEKEFLKLAKYDPERGPVHVQRSGCETTGEVFVRIITGHLKDLPASELQKRIDRVVHMIVEATGRKPILDPLAPLWIQAEFVENMLDFEQHPPCGCAPDPAFVPKEDGNGGKQT